MTPKDFEPRTIQCFIDAAAPGNEDGFYGIYNEYAETEAANPSGAVYRFFVGDDGDPAFASSLNTDDGLCSIWASPQGNLWVGSLWGRVWTTAKVKWPTKHDDVDADDEDPNFTWRVTDAPRDSNDGGFNIAAIWGSSDTDVHFGTFEGAILHWDGKQWSVASPEAKRIKHVREFSIQSMHGTGPIDAWAVGREGIVLHCDGQRWRKVALPKDAKDENLTGVWARSPEEVFVCSTSGAIFHGNKNGLERLGDFKPSFYGIVEFDDRLILAGGDDGVFELKGNKLKSIRKTFAATGVYHLGARVGFVQPDQDSPRVVVYEPAGSEPWYGWGG